MREVHRSGHRGVKRALPPLLRVRVEERVGVRRSVVRQRQFLVVGQVAFKVRSARALGFGAPLPRSWSTTLVKDCDHNRLYVVRHNEIDRVREAMK
jgi:hypothetical protein